MGTHTGDFWACFSEKGVMRGNAMARYKDSNRIQGVLLPVSVEAQIMPGTFEHCLMATVANLDLTALDKRYRNDSTGAPAFDPRILLKVVIYAYSRGLYSSRRIEAACSSNVVFMVLAEFMRPDFTTISNFISGLTDEVAGLFVQILEVCAKQNLIGAEMLAVDGCKIPSNASKDWSGTVSGLENKKCKWEERAREILSLHVDTDNEDEGTRLAEVAAKMQKKAEKLAAFVKDRKPKSGARGRERQSNVTDNESAKMKTSHGVIQGYNGIALVDERHQIILQAEAFGTGDEHDVLIPVVEKGKENLATIGLLKASGLALLADNGYYKEANLEYLQVSGIDGYIPDNQYRNRLQQTRQFKKIKSAWFKKSDFDYKQAGDYYLCPNGKQLSPRGNPAQRKDGYKYVSQRYEANRNDCRSCPLQRKCLRSPTTVCRTVTRIIQNRTQVSFSEQMKQKMSTPQSHRIYARRMGIVEPVFANITKHKRLDRFTLRTKAKVDTQWKLYCMVHNIEKLAGAGRIGH